MATKSIPRVSQPPVDHYTSWILAVLTFGIGDVLSTWWFLQQPGNVEDSPVALAVIDSIGVVGLIVWKLVVLAVFYAIYRYSPKNWRAGVPIGLAVLGSVVIAWNTISSTLGLRLAELL